MGQDLGFAILDVVTVASFGIPEVGVPIAATLTGLGMALRALTSDGSAPPQSLSKEDLEYAIKNALKDTLARQHANNIVASYLWYNQEMASLLWPESYKEIPKIADDRLKELRDALLDAIRGTSSLQTSIANLEDPEFGKYFISGLVMGQCLTIQYEKLLVVIDRHLYKSRSVDRINTLIRLYERYIDSLLKVERGIEFDLRTQWEKEFPPGRKWDLKRRDQLVNNAHQGNKDLVTKVTMSFGKQRGLWLEVKRKDQG